MPFRKLGLILFVANLFIHAAYAEELTGTLKKIKESGMVVIGHRESSIPFSYYGTGQQVIGYSQDYANAIVEAIKQQLQLPDLKVKLLPITSQNRIPLLQNGTYDFECGSTTNNAIRQKQVDFSDTLLIVSSRFLVNKASNIHSLNELKEKNVTTTAGTTAEVRLNQLNDNDHLGMHIITAKDHSGAFRTLEAGRAIAFLMDDALLVGERAKAKKPSDWIIVGEPQSKEAYACMLRKEDKPLKALMDQTIANIQTSGEAEKIFDRWFKQPIPPKGINLDFSLSDDNKALFKAPNDKPLD